MSNIRHSTIRPIESKKSDPTNKANRIEFATFDPTECTRLCGMSQWFFASSVKLAPLQIRSFSFARQYSGKLDKGNSVAGSRYCYPY